MLTKPTRRTVLGSLLAVPAGLVLGCNQASNESPPLPPGTAPPPSLSGADAKKANSPTGGSSSSADPNPSAR